MLLLLYASMPTLAGIRALPVVLGTFESKSFSFASALKVMARAKDFGLVHRFLGHVSYDWHIGFVHVNM